MTSAARMLLQASRQLEAASSDAEFGAALEARDRCVRRLGRLEAGDAEDVRAALTLGEQVREAVLRSLVEDRAALERLRAMAPACHARSSVACTG